MSEQVQVTILSPEQLASMSPADIMAYIRGVEASIDAARDIVHVARQKQTADAREALQANLRVTLRFPMLSAEVLASLKAANATGFNVAYSLEDGVGTCSPIYGKAYKAAVKHNAAEAGTVTVTVQRPVTADWEAATTQEQRAEDEAEWIAKVAEAIARGGYHGSEGKAVGAIKLFVQKRRLHKLGVEGY